MSRSLETKPSSSIKYGDIIELGDHVLVCGDARDTDLVARVLKDRTIDVILTDPPYGVDVVASKQNFQELVKNKHIENDGLCSDVEYIEFSKAWLKPVLPYLKKRNAIYIFNADKMVFALREALVQLKVKVSQLLVWAKDRAIIGRLDYLPQHELIVYGWFGTHDFKRSKSKSVLYFPKPTKNTLHPTMKSVPLLRHLILNSSKVGDVIYDPFAGSGSLLIACEQTKRKSIKFELDVEYCQTIVDRYNKLAAKQ